MSNVQYVYAYLACMNGLILCNIKLYNKLIWNLKINELSHEFEPYKSIHCLKK
jgi:hypothetical protein